MRAAQKPSCPENGWLGSAKEIVYSRPWLPLKLKVIMDSQGKNHWSVSISWIAPNAAARVSKSAVGREKRPDRFERHQRFGRGSMYQFLNSPLTWVAGIEHDHWSGEGDSNRIASGRRLHGSSLRRTPMRTFRSGATSRSRQYTCLCRPRRVEPHRQHRELDRLWS